MQDDHDEKPIGGGLNKDEVDEQVTTADKADLSGPIEERLLSKNWSTRDKAFEELRNLFKSAKPKDDVFRDHSSNWKKYLNEANPRVIEQVLNALTCYIENSEPKNTLTSQNDIIKALIEKCINHTKPSIKKQGLECFLQLFEMTEAFDEAKEQMIELLAAKNIKVQQGSQMALNSLLLFGTKRVDLKYYLEQVIKNCNSTNPQVKSEAMGFFKEAYKWLGDGVKNLLQDQVKKQQMEELEKAFEELKDKPKEQRLTRSDKEKKKNQNINSAAAEEEEKKQQQQDIYNLAKAVDLLGNYNQEWIDKILEMKKWNEKKEQLENLLKDCSVTKVEKGDYLNLIDCLKKLMNDTNQVVQLSAVKALNGLTKALNKDFENYAKDLLSLLISKFKEKKATIVDEVHEILQSFMQVVKIDEVISDIHSGIKDKFPSVKKNSCIFLERYAQVSYIDILQRAIGDDLISQLVKQAEDQAADLRDQALQLLGVLKARLGESVMSKYLQDLNPQKQSKINEGAALVKPSQYDKPEKQPQIEKKGPPKRQMAKKEEKKKVEEIEEIKQEKKEVIDEDVTMQEEPIIEKKPLKKKVSQIEKMEIDDQPIKRQDMDEIPLKSGGMNEEQPIGGEKPISRGAYNLDDLEAQEQEFMRKQELEKKKKAEMTKKKPDPVASKPTKKTGPTKENTKGGDIEDEGASGGLSKEEAEEKMSQAFPEECISKFEEAKWQEKVEGMKMISELIKEQQVGADVIEAIAKFFKSKMKDWKESNVNIVKECINTFIQITISCEKINRRAVSCLMPFLTEKLGDVKTLNLVNELMINLAEMVTPKYMALQVIKNASTAKAPNTIKESCNILNKMCEEFGGTYLPLKEMIDFGNNTLAHSNQQVRNSAMSLFAILYKHAGEAIKNFLKDVKESTMKVLETEFQKVTPYKKGEFQSKRQFRGEAAQEFKEAGGKKGAAAGGGLDALPREDISKQINPKLITMFKNNDWKVRKEAAEKVEEMLKNANMRILPNGLNELMDNMKQRMADPNKSVLKSYIQLIGNLAEALGPASKQYQKKLLPIMIQNLADKQSLVRQDALAACSKWAAELGPEGVITSMGPLLIQENPELRSEGLNFITKHKDTIKLISGPDCKDNLVKPIISCLSDKAPAIRNLAEPLTHEIMAITGYPPFKSVLDDLKPAVQNQLKPILEKCKQKVGNVAPVVQQQEQMNSSITKTQENEIQKQPKLQKSGASTNKNIPTAKSEKKEGGNTQTAQQTTQMSSFGEAANKRKLEKQQPASKQREASKEPKLKASIRAPEQKVEVNVESEPLAQINRVNGLREKRIEYDRKNKWQLDVLKQDQIEKVKLWTNQTLGADIGKKMWSSEFKQHQECIEFFLLCSQQQDEEFKDILDLIFKWALIKLNEGNNMQFMIKLFDFFNQIFQVFIEQNYLLADFEANVIIPVLCEKTGLNNMILKEKVKNLIRLLQEIYDKQKAYQLIIQYGLNSKNMKAQAECLDEVAKFIKDNGVDYTSDKDVKLIAKMADSSDKGVRENSVAVMAEIFKHIDQDIWRILGDVTPKVQDLLESRFKKTKVLNGSSSQMIQPVNTQVPNQKNKQSTAELSKNIKTPRTNLQFSKGIGGLQKQSDNNLSRSINQYSQGTTEEPKKIQKKELPTMRRQSTLNEEQKMNQTMLGKRQQVQSQRLGQAESVNNQTFTKRPPQLQDVEMADDEVSGQREEILKHINQLKFGDLSKRVDSLVSLNELISALEQNKEALQQSGNDLVNAFTHVLMDIFDKPVEDIPLRFAKYFITIVLKACSCKEIMKEVDYERILQLAEQLLTRLLIDNLDKVGENKEGELILKNLNSSMLRLLENCNHTHIICVLFDLLAKYKDYHQLPKLPGLIIKCLLKLSKILEKLIEKLDIERILKSIHEYLILIKDDQKSQNDEMGIRIVKTILNELVKLKKQNIMEAYKVVENHPVKDQHILRWIQIINKQMNHTTLEEEPASQDPQSIISNKSQNNALDTEMEQLIEELKDSDKFEQAIPKLHQMLERNKSIDLNSYISKLTKTFQDFIKNNLAKFRESIQDTHQESQINKSEKTQEGMTNSLKTEASSKYVDSEDANNKKISDIQNKLLGYKQRLNNKGDKTVTAKDNNQSLQGCMSASKQQQNLNTSFSAMNASLSQKWQERNKKKDTNMNLTMGGFGSGQQLTVEQQDGNQSRGNQEVTDQVEQKTQQMSEGATNSDLNQRLAEMKAKIQALKKNQNS